MRGNTLIELAIFDLDGTLIDSLGDIAEAANEALRECALPAHTVDAYKHFIGNGLETLVKRIAEPNDSPHLLEELFHRFKNNYQRNWNRLTRPYPGIIEMLADLKAREIATAVLSNKPHSFTLECAAQFFFDHEFETILGQRPGTPIKPHPAAALAIAAGCGIAPGSCLFVGDSAVDVATGKAAGMVTAGVTWGFRYRAELEEAGADYIIDRPAELLQLLVSDD